MGPRFGVLLLLLFAVAAAIGVAAGKSQSEPISAGTVAAAATPTAAPIAGFIQITTNPDPNHVGEFVPAVYRGHVGQKITFVNEAGVDHTVLADNGAFSSPVLSHGQVYSWTPTKPGRYVFGCYLHPDMRGEIVVGP